jgi:hypothetical protein
MVEINRESYWREFTTLLDMYKYYFSIPMKTNAFYYASTSAILGIYHQSSVPDKAKIILMFPVIVGVSLLLVCIVAYLVLNPLVGKIRDLGNELNLQYIFKIDLLSILLVGSGLGYLLTASYIFMRYFLVL